MTALSDNTRGALFMCLSMAGFGINDGFIKLAFEDLPLAEAIAIRGIFATFLLAMIAWSSGAFRARPGPRDRRFVALRTVGEVGATASFLVAISQLPIADATAVLQAAPLAVTMAAALILGEHVGWRRWTAILVGFVGVVVMVRPFTDAFTLWAMLPVVTVCFIALRDLITRSISKAVPAALASTVTGTTITLIAIALIPFNGWVTPDPMHLAMLATSSGFLVVGYLFAVSAMRVGDVSAVSPFRYTVLLWAIVVGFVLFGDVPDTYTIVGAALVTGAGLYTLWREQIRGRSRTAARAPAHPFDAPRLAHPEPDAESVGRTRYSAP